MIAIVDETDGWWSMSENNYRYPDWLYDEIWDKGKVAMMPAASVIYGYLKDKVWLSDINHIDTCDTC